jgi:proteasome lid subunit RPN8/RPN11
VSLDGSKIDYLAARHRREGLDLVGTVHSHPAVADLPGRAGRI